MSFTVIHRFSWFSRRWTTQRILFGNERKRANLSYTFSFNSLSQSKSFQLCPCLSTHCYLFLFNLRKDSRYSFPHLLYRFSFQLLNELTLYWIFETIFLIWKNVFYFFSHFHDEISVSLQFIQSVATSQSKNRLIHHISLFMYYN